MKQNEIVLGVIPARGGSKGVPRKNLRLVQGKPLVVHAIECGLLCPSIDELIVSTDDEEIAQVSRQAGAKVPFLRPAQLASDTAGTLPVLAHAITAMEEQGDCRVEVVVLLEPTGPLRIPEDIEGAMALYRQGNCDVVVSGTDSSRNPYFNMVLEKEGYASLVCEDLSITRRQDAPRCYDLAPIVWIFSRKAIFENQRLPPKTKLIPIPRSRCVDLDTEEDFRYLEFLLSDKNTRFA